MPFYFAYGANMDMQAMGKRCPRSVPLGPARLAGFSFFVTQDGYASVRPRSGGVVHGLGWTLALRDIAALDRYEAIETGLYRKHVLPVRTADRIWMALVYVARCDKPGSPMEGYMESVIASAEALSLPRSHLEDLRQWLPGGRFTRPGAPGSPLRAASGRSAGQAGQGSVERRPK